MKCFFCDGEMGLVITEIDTGWGKYDITIKGVNAYICNQCGHEVYGPEEVKLIQDISQAFIIELVYNGFFGKGHNVIHRNLVE